MIIDYTNFFLILQDENFKKIITTLMIGIILYLIDSIIISKLVRSLQPIERRFQFKKIINYTIIFIFLIIVFFLWFGESRNSFATFLGLISAGLAIAIKDPITSLIAWLTILVSRNYYLEGDRIEIDELKGDVIEITPLFTSLMEVGNWVDADQSTGRIVQVPNHKIFTSDVYNYNRKFPYIWEEFNVLITFESDYKLAKQIIENISDSILMESANHAEKIYRDKAAKSTFIKYNNFKPIIYTEIKDSGVELSLRYMVEVRKRRFFNMKISEALLEEFNKVSNVELAYPTLRIYKNGE